MLQYSIIITDGSRLKIHIPVRSRITAYRAAAQLSAISGLAAQVMEDKVIPRRRRKLKTYPAATSAELGLLYTGEGTPE
jgi:hypothetical protein